jgi:hypothetical protein
MTTTVADQFISQPDWWITTGRDPIPAVPNYHGAKDCTLEADEEAVGTYHLVLGNGGIDSAHREIHVDADSTFLTTVSVVDVDNTHKTIRFERDTGVGVAPNQIHVSVRRLISP